MEITVPEGVTEEEILSSIEASLVSELGLHPQNVEVSFDSETGVVTYVLTSDNAEDLVGLQEEMGSESFVNTLDASLGADIVVDSLTAPDTVTVNVDFVVDASNVTDVDAAVASVENTLSEQEFNYESSGN